ncbi:MAG TPA: tRNA (N6-threonylcarbamoyladenosine(37)-N6)-methyltransferase TrmO [Bacteriovoracaceae bacterium]|nr:tRNA (N6-threonylcarbamoyladenosine(37)-N6)-methyltransferase TrmO [Bacteriovoracaceae bacterium]
MEPIATIKTPFHEKFGVPRQPLLIPEAWGRMSFAKTDFYTEAFRGLEGFSHLWLIFEFHQIDEGKFNALVRPPRFEGKRKLGVFATRSPHRPNRLGLSVVKFEKIEMTDNEVILWVSGVDLVDGTPILDIKPYIPYVDRVESATSVEFTESPKHMQVKWLCDKPTDAILIEKVVALDPRPGHDRKDGEEFGVSVAGWNVRFKEANNVLLILTVKTQKNNPSH